MFLYFISLFAEAEFTLCFKGAESIQESSDYLKNYLWLQKQVMQNKKRIYMPDTRSDIFLKIKAIATDFEPCSISEMKEMVDFMIIYGITYDFGCRFLKNASKGIGVHENYENELDRLKKYIENRSGKR